MLAPERQPPVTRDVQAPGVFPVTAQAVRFPGRERSELADACHILQEGEHLSQFVERVGREALGLVG